MNFNKCLKTTELILLSGEVPLIIGESGVGKTSLVKNLSRKNNYYLVTIDANLLKEGEIGGLPTIEDREYIKNGARYIKKATVYATHTKLLEIDEALKEREDKEVLLFIDELNRCEHAVLQELMNLILNREINGYKLSDRVNVIAAMNPSNKYEDFEESSYEVYDMDPAQEDRFVFLELETDPKEWIKWGMTNGKIEEEVVEFISAFPEYLSSQNQNETIRATPRSWERVSKGLKIYKKNKDEFDFEIFYNLVKGNVGSSIAQDFSNFINSANGALIKPQEIFEDEILPYSIKERLIEQSHSRLYIIAKNAVTYLNTKFNKTDLKEKDITIFSDVLRQYPKDLRMGIMKELKSDYEKEFYECILDNDEFIKVFFEIYD